MGGKKGGGGMNSKQAAGRAKKEENEAIKTIVIKWECEWKIEKKSGEVAFFINNKFIEKPRRRLIPRDSCEYYFPLLTALAVFFAFPSCRTSLRPT